MSGLLDRSPVTSGSTGLLDRPGLAREGLSERGWTEQTIPLTHQDSRNLKDDPGGTDRPLVRDRGPLRLSGVGLGEEVGLEGVTRYGSHHRNDHRGVGYLTPDPRLPCVRRGSLP